MSAYPAHAASHGGSSRQLRLINERTALGCLFLRESLTRPELVALTGFSKPTASEVIKRLRTSGLVHVIGTTSGGPGPRADVYAINPAAGFTAAVSVREPDSVDVAIDDLCGKTRVTTRLALAGASTESAIASGLDSACADANIQRNQLRFVCLAVPGSFDGRDDRVRNIDVPGLDEPGLRCRLQQRLGTGVRIDNDVNLAALAERHHGSGGTDGFGLLWLGEAGIGLGIDLGDDAGGGLLQGFRGAAGEIGYLPVGFGGDRRPPDLQELAGGPAMVALSRARGRPVNTAREAIILAAGDDDFFSIVAERIAVGLASIVTVLDPALIVLAGDIGAAESDQFTDAVSAALSDRGFGTRVVKSAVTGDAVLRGGQDAALSMLRRQLLAES